MAKTMSAFRNKFDNIQLKDVDVSQLADIIREMTVDDPDYDKAMKLWNAVKEQGTTVCGETTGDAAVDDVDMTVPDNKRWVIHDARIRHDDATARLSQMLIEDVLGEITGLFNQESLAQTTFMYLHERAPSRSKLELSAGSIFRGQSVDLAAGKKLTVWLLYTEYDVI